MAAVDIDNHEALVGKLKHAFGTYESASKKYLSAVKDLDSAMETIAIAFRELAQGELDEPTKQMTDRLCSAIDSHKAAKTVKKGETAAPADASSYSFASYMNDFSREITNAMTSLKDITKTAEKAKDARDKSAKKYQEARADVDETETKLAKKNQSVQGNEKYVKKCAKRDETKKLYDADETKYKQTMEQLLNVRRELLKKSISAMGNYGSKYFTTLARTLNGGQ